jgi:ribosomal protein S27E
MYEPLETVKCKKCGKIIAEPKELIRIQKKQ